MRFTLIMIVLGILVVLVQVIIFCLLGMAKRADDLLEAVAATEPHRLAPDKALHLEGDRQIILPLLEFKQARMNGPSPRSET